MPAADPLSALEVPGKLIVELAGQTLDETAAYPYGGTDLGLIKDVAYQIVTSRDELPGEEYGGGDGPPVGVFDVQYLGQAWLIAFALRGWQNEAHATLWPNTSVGTLGGRRGVLGEGSVLPGHLRGAAAVPLLFVPEDVANHNAVFLPLAIPEVARDLTVALAHRNEHLILAGFRAIFEATKVPQIQLLEDMSL